ncbi:SOS response-associated peptidase [Brevibacillus choshinensis]|uniref:Abasic site processing protein n=1 Tax=Brevibacillus choshinensis TaxID=54911 RepID=A0ABX7FK21_BRECH|nr:SOS response-associated peptidase [Brevibacillus choshinensis]QRG65975.1 SOS response-associated peptidase [Brevibacillus choshinensis]
MCGRFTIAVSHEDLLLRFSIAEAIDLFHSARYNVAPMQMTPAVINDGKRNRIDQLRWGLIPSWAKDGSMAGKMINARAETVLDKASFKNLIYRKRCIIPADSFYEWKNVNEKKQPMRIMMRDECIFSLAGLYDTWINPVNGQRLGTFTIITTKPNRLVEEVHDRMPVILSREKEGIWLDRGNTNMDEILDLLQPYPAEEMIAYPVSTLVGNVKNDSPECIEMVRG